MNPVAYVDEHGMPRGQVTATWGAVTTDVAGVALNVGGYELFMRLNEVDAPPVPTAPVLESRLGVVHVSWDGLGIGAAPMPPDLLRVLVWMQDPLNPGWEEIGYLDAAGSLVVPGLPYGQDREFSSTAVDRSGNSSARSSSATTAAVQLVQGDAANESITSAKIIAGQILAGHIAAEQ